MSFFEKYINSKFYSVIEYIYRFVTLNLAFIALSILGFGIFSIFPAFITLTYFIKKIIEKKNFNVGEFIQIFKENYLKSEVMFLIYLLIGLVFSFNTYYFISAVLELNNILNIIGLVLAILLDVFFLMSVIQSILIIIYFPDSKIKEIIKCSFIFTMDYFPKNILLLISILCISIISYILLNIPFMFVTFSFLAYLIISLFYNNYYELIYEKENDNNSDDDKEEKLQ